MLFLIGIKVNTKEPLHSWHQIVQLYFTYSHRVEKTFAVHLDKEVFLVYTFLLMNRYKNILLVEDDEDDQLFFKEALNDIFPRATCLIANNGSHALDLLDIFPLPDIIFLDTNLPMMNGFECLTAIKKKEAYQHIPVVILAGSRFNIEGWYDAGASLYVIKPASEDEFRNTLRDILTRNLKKDAQKLRDSLSSGKSRLA
jgi:CheY-like chemotaxis protein